MDRFESVRRHRMWGPSQTGPTPDVEGANRIAPNRTIDACCQYWPYRAFRIELCLWLKWR
jgi:hypothetical protein